MRNIVLTDGFLEAAYELPKGTAKKMIKTLHLFAKNKYHPSLHLEKLAGAAEGRCSIRVDDNLRIILEDGDPPVLIHVGSHDDAYRAASRMPRLPTLVPSMGRDKSAGELEVLRRILEPKRTPQEMPSVKMRVPLAQEQLKPFLVHSRKYFPLTRYLIRVGKVTLTLTFKEIEKLLVEGLPHSARKYAAWWANDATHSQALSWLVAGYQSRNLQLKEERIDFQKR